MNLKISFTLYYLIYFFCYRIRKRKADIFAILKSEEKLNTLEVRDTSSSTSSFTARVSSGQVRRTTTLDGDYFVDIKVYNTADWVGYKPEERYKKALSYVKIQTDINSPEWEALQRFLGLAFVRFEHSEPVFFKNTK